jgi:hypothetical protein
VARFKYLGQPPRAIVETYGPTIIIRIQKKDGSVQELTPVAPATEFVVGDDIGYDITDQRALRTMRCDPRFQEI